MKIVTTGYGGPAQVLKQVPSDDRDPGSAEVAIAVRAIGVNAKDVKLYISEDYSRHRAHAARFPLDLGLEASGVVTAIGPNAHGPAGPIEVGDEVIAYRIDGAYADRIVVAAANVVPKPTRLSWEQAGSTMLVATTAAHALAAVRARPGQTILLHGAAGSVGRCVLQLAALAGVKVVGTAAERHFERLRGYGATPVRYGDGLEGRVRTAAPGGVDAAIDVVGTDEAIDVSLALVKDCSRIATIANAERGKQSGILMLGGEPGQDEAGIAIRNNARLVITTLAQAGAFDVVVDRSFPLDRVAEAHELMRAGGAGRIVLIP